jgi:hypothetical protein
MFRNQVRQGTLCRVHFKAMPTRVETPVCMSAVRHGRNNMESTRTTFSSRIRDGGGKAGQLHGWDGGTRSGGIFVTIQSISIPFQDFCFKVHFPLLSDRSARQYALSCTFNLDHFTSPSPTVSGLCIECLKYHHAIPMLV